MPYTHVGKTVYKKNPDGSRGKKVGTTKGNVKDYLAALYSAEKGAGKKSKKGKGYGAGK
jgi:hypothetical protein